MKVVVLCEAQSTLGCRKPCDQSSVPACLIYFKILVYILLHRPVHCLTQPRVLVILQTAGGRWQYPLYQRIL